MHLHSMAAPRPIEIWIDALPTPPLKRAVSERRPLYEIGSNMDRTPIRGSKAINRGQEADDLELSTPRALTIPHPADVSMCASPSLSSESSMNSRTGFSDAASSRSQGLKRRRSESPKKRLANLTLARYPVIQRSIGALRDLPSGAQTLAKNMRRCQLRVGILHPESRDTMRPFLDIDSDDEMTDRLFSDGRGLVGDAPRIADMMSIVRQANENEAEQASEAAWNGDVHTALLRVSLRCSKWRDELRCDNVTTASIEAGAFSLPQYRQGLEELGSRIDFSIGIRLADDIKRRLSRCISSLNPTLYEPTRWSPTAIHIETKLTGEGWRAAQSQLSLWVTQHVAKLRELLALADQPEGIPLPVLPVLVGQGHDWTVLFFEDHVDGARLYSGFSIGSSKNEVDAEAVCAGFHFLMDWAQTEYRLWFEKMILHPLLESISSRECH
ncbi:Hypothetical protein R9X50_00407900 [Acrodontium crateriforme]|uniref:PD-(D/E)XK nuclease-like domain-containing protein n=1 Tax=Acrodontium crateriforme TaxID=150365 RepID=A0AAQ3M3Q1_9PEZI|nr:Hypothetical protein R9X50_00407900 [Acrodontium crateriforme]